MHTSTIETQATMTPTLAISLLKEGNERFRANRAAPRDLMQRVIETRKGQWPFAAVLSCIDSRVSAELVFDQGIGDIFSARVAGNVVNDDIIGSLEFSCKIAGARLVVVLGHTACGAVKGACAGVRLGKLSTLLEKLQPAIEATGLPQDPRERNAENGTFVQNVAVNNVKFVTENILKQSDVLREMHGATEIGLVGAMYDIESGQVEFLP